MTSGATEYGFAAILGEFKVVWALMIRFLS
jgi:hypothetical protein